MGFIFQVYTDALTVENAELPLLVSGVCHEARERLAALGWCTADWARHRRGPGGSDSAAVARPGSDHHLGR
jgi:hypothetical protein